MVSYHPEILTLMVFLSEFNYNYLLRVMIKLYLTYIDVDDDYC